MGMNIASPASVEARRDWMKVLARASAQEIEAGLGGAGALPAYELLRGPEMGLVMVRGRAGGSGAPFNLGEMTVTRCTVKVEEGNVGHAYITGRDMRKAELAALADALLQREVTRSELQMRLVEPLRAVQAAARKATRAKAEATKVQFFALRNMRT